MRKINYCRTKSKENGLVFRYYRCTKKGTNCTQKYLRGETLISQLNAIFQKVALPDDWIEPIFNKLDKEEKEIAQSSASFAQNLKSKIEVTDNKLAQLLDMQLDGVITLDEYKRKKEELINRKTELKQKLKDSGRRGNYWLGPMRNFISDCQQAPRVARTENLEEKRSFLQKIGSDWKITDKKIDFSPQNAYVLLRRYKNFSAFPTWGG